MLAAAGGNRRERTAAERRDERRDLCAPTDPEDDPGKPGDAEGRQRYRQGRVACGRARAGDPARFVDPGLARAHVSAADSGRRPSQGSPRRGSTIIGATRSRHAR